MSAMRILAGNWEVWRIKKKQADGTTKTINTTVYVVRLPTGKLARWSREDNLDRLNELLRDYEPDERRELPEGLYYEYKISMDIDSGEATDPNFKDDYDDIVQIRFSKPYKIPSNRLMGEIVREINQMSVSPRNEGMREGARSVIKTFNWTSLRSKNKYKLLRDIDVGLTTKPPTTRLRFKRREVR